MKYVLNTLAAIMAFGMLTVAMPDIAFAGSAKVEVCHIPPGNPEIFHTIRINEKVLSAHLAHGDLAGACDAACAALCDDGNACTIDDTADCEQNGCPVTPEPVDCNDQNECTADSCASASGCVNTPRLGESCNDDQTCSGPDTCNAEGACVGPAIADCCLGDGDCSQNMCDQASCNLDTNRCGNDPVVCNPSDLCQVSVCSDTDGECEETPIVCNEGETCNVANGLCELQQPCPCWTADSLGPSKIGTVGAFCHYQDPYGGLATIQGHSQNYNSHGRARLTSTSCRYLPWSVLGIPSVTSAVTVPQIDACRQLIVDECNDRGLPIHTCHPFQGC